MEHTYDVGFISTCALCWLLTWYCGEEGMQGHGDSSLVPLSALPSFRLYFPSLSLHFPSSSLPLSIAFLFFPAPCPVFNTAGLPAEDGGNLQTQIVSDRQRMVLNCTVPTSLPPASIQWEHNSNDLVFNSGRMGITLSGNLVISSIDEDNGRFHCYASNDVIANSRRYTTGYLLFCESNTTWCNDDVITIDWSTQLVGLRNPCHYRPNL